MQDVGREDREEHHAHDRKQHAEDLADGRHGEDRGPDRGNIHPGPPQRIAESVKIGIDQCLIVVENQCRDVGEHDHRDDIGRQEPLYVPAYQPAHDDHQRQEGPQQGNQAEEHAQTARKLHAAPMYQRQIGNRQQQERQVAPHEVRSAIGNGQPQEEITQKDHTDHELHEEKGTGEGGMIPPDHLPRYGDKKNQSGEELDNSEYTKQVFMQGRRSGHVFFLYDSFSAHGSKSMPRRLHKKKRRSAARFFGQSFCKYEIFHYLCTRISAMAG